MDTSDEQLSRPHTERIRRVDESGRDEAIGRLMFAGAGRRSHEAKRFLHYAEDRSVDLTHLWASYDARDRPVAAVLIVPQIGRTGMTFMSCPRRRGDIDELAEVLGRAVEHLPADQVALVQGLVDTDEHLEQAVLQRSGFVELATLRYMQRTVRSDAPAPTWPPPAQLLTWREDLRDQFVDLLGATYIDTLDCCGLHGTRRGEDVLEGHMATGQFAAPWWTLLKVDGQSAGMMLLSPVPDANGVELVYLGLAPAHRGKGLATLLVQHGLWQCARAGQRKLCLAVDEQNTPALRLYKRFAFRGSTRKLAYICRNT